MGFPNAGSLRTGFSGENALASHDDVAVFARPISTCHQRSMSPQPDLNVSCPSCRGKEVVRGSLIASDENNQFDGRFFPEGLKFAAIRRSVHVLDSQGFNACTACGCLWNHVDAVKLRELLEKNKRKSPSRFLPGWSHGSKWTLLLMSVLVLVGGALALSSLIRG